MPNRSPIAVAMAMGLAVLSAAPLRAETKPPGWSTTANLGGVFTSGNSSTSSLGTKLRFERNWIRTFFFFEGAAVYQSAAEGVLFAVGTPDDFTLVDERESEQKAENYYLETGFERRLTDRWFWTLGSGWRRDLFAGIESQLSLRGGAGYAHVTPTSEVKLGALITFTDQQDVAPDPELENPFVGGRLYAEYLKKFGDGARSQFKSRFALDQNFQTGDDTRVLWDNALTVSMTRRLAIQVGYLLNWRNLPAFEEIRLFTARPPEGSSSTTVLRRLDKLDQTLQVSLVINWSSPPPPAANPTP